MKMPVLFVGHGSPMNAIEDNQYAKGWKKISRELPEPKAILAVSAHWATEGSYVNDSEDPEIIYDMYGFPRALYEVDYPCEGAPLYAHMTQDLVTSFVDVDNTWGIDHGTWSVLHHLFPEANVPVFQLSVNMNAKPEELFEIGREIAALREQGVMILGSGNVIHNLALLDWNKNDGFDYAEDFDAYIKKNIEDRQFDNVIHFERFQGAYQRCFSTPEHFYPLLYCLGAVDAHDELTIFNNSRVYGSLSMTCYLFKEDLLS